jgi:hypothetical protein
MIPYLKLVGGMTDGTLGKRSGNKAEECWWNASFDMQHDTVSLGGHG